MQTDNRLLDDVARVASGALGTLAGVKDEIEILLRQQFEKVLANMELVSRDEFEAVKEMAAKARTEQEDLQTRLEALEARLAAAGGKKAEAKAATGKAAKAKPRAAKPRAAKSRAKHPAAKPTST